MPISVPINLGSAPEIDIQVTDPRLVNGFVSNDAIHFLPQYSLLKELPNIRAIHYTQFNDSYVIVTLTDIYYYSTAGLQLIGSISQSVSAIRIAENQNNQLVIVNGTYAYVYDQKTSTLTQLGDKQTFDINNPVDVIIINTLTIIAGGTDKKWSVSTTNNALVWNDNDIVVSDDSVGKLTGLGETDNNLFIFGEFGVQRWVPGTETNIYGFPFNRDPSFRQDYGAVSTASIISKDNAIYYLSNDTHIRRISSHGVERLTTAGQALAIAVNDKVENSTGAYYDYKGTYFYHLSLNNGSWVFNTFNSSWSESELFLQGYDRLAIKSSSIGELGNFIAENSQKLVLHTPYLDNSTKNPLERAILNQVTLLLSQGNFSSENEQIVELSISLDGLFFGNRVKVDLAKAGQRLSQARWYMNLVSTGFALKFTLYTNYDLSIKGATYN